MTAKDKDPILDQKFFELLYPMIHPNIPEDILKHSYEQDMLKHRLYGIGKLLEAAISEKKGLQREDTEGRDFVDGSDAKSASARWASKGRVYSAAIRDISNKRGLLRCVIYERLQDKFYYFLIPYRAYENIPKTSNIEIPFEADGSPRRQATRLKNVDWWTFEVENFAGILSDTPAEFEFIKEQKFRVQQEKVRARLERMRLRELRKQNKPEPSLDSLILTKNHPMLQTAILYTQESDQSETQDQPDTPPTYLYDLF